MKNSLIPTLTLSPKQRYAQAVISGTMTKAAAYTTFINPTSCNASQASYRLEQTQSMRKLMDAMRTEYALSQSIKQKQLRMLERSLSIVSDLLEREGKTTQEELATLRLVKALSGQIDRADDNPIDTDSLKPINTLDRSHVIM